MLAPGRDPARDPPGLHRPPGETQPVPGGSGRGQQLDGLGPGQERMGVPPPGQVFLPGIGQTRRGILADRLKQTADLDAGQRIRWRSWHRWIAVCLVAYR
jgi:hypothetical protein